MAGRRRPCRSAATAVSVTAPGPAAAPSAARAAAVAVLLLLGTGSGSADRATDRATRDNARLLARVEADLASRNLTLSGGSRCRSIFWGSGRCLCDRECGVYGDCCLDVAAPAAARGDLSCRDIPAYERSVYMVTRCPDRWGDDSVRRLCSGDGAEDPFAGLPVSNRVSRMTYGNVYCAVCHEDARGSVPWTSGVDCESITADMQYELNITSAFIEKNLVRNSAGQWGVYLLDGDNETFHECNVGFYFPKTLDYLLRPCEQKISSCAPNWTEPEIEELCGAYNAYITASSEAAGDLVRYRNVHCAICNYVSMDCLWPDFTDYEPEVSVFLHVRITHRFGGDQTGPGNACSSSQLWDPFFKRCRDVVCGARRFRLPDGSCGDAVVSSDVLNKRNQTSNGTSHASFAFCPKHFYTDFEYVTVENGTVYVPVHDLTYTVGEFELRDGELVVCAVTEDLSKFDGALSYISLVCLVASVLCLLLHLVAVMAVPELRNPPGKSMTSLTVCLLIGYLCFLVSPSQEPGARGCALLAAVTYFSMMGSLFWMNVLAYDVFRIARRASTSLRVSGGHRLKRFALYALYACTATTAAGVAAVVADTSPAVPDQYRPGFGERVCWFSRRRALVAFFAAPLAATMAVNVVLFVASARLIQASTSATARSSRSRPRKTLRVSSWLAAIMGLSWVVGLAAGWFDFQPLQYVFVILNTLQGVFIFATFSMDGIERWRAADQEPAEGAAGRSPHGRPDGGPSALPEDGTGRAEPRPEDPQDRETEENASVVTTHL